jgi:hypothetical protein
MFGPKKIKHHPNILQEAIMRFGPICQVMKDVFKRSKQYEKPNQEEMFGPKRSNIIQIIYLRLAGILWPICQVKKVVCKKSKV